jgi:glycerol-3-phosphate dehydrogenase
MEPDFAIIGAGVVGCAIAREISGRGASVVVIEAREDVGEETSKANTAILHTGFDMTPGTLESKLVSSGYFFLHDYAKANNIALEETGAVLVAWNQVELDELVNIEGKAKKNNYDDTYQIDAKTLYEIEPNLGLGALGALVVPGEYIIDPWSISIAFATQAIKAGAHFKFNQRVTSISQTNGIFNIDCGPESFHAKFLINAAGLYSDEIDGMLGYKEFTITPRRGELIVFDKFSRYLISHIILPVPTKMGKGVLVAPTIYGNVMLGPTAEDLEDKSNNKTSETGLKGLLEKGERLCPKLLSEEITASYAGLRAASTSSDYIVELRGDIPYITIAGIRSTGLTASIAIAKHVTELIASTSFKFNRASSHEDLKMPPLGEKQIRPYRNADLIERDKDYGEVICFCEKVSRGEISDAFNSTLPPKSLSGLSRRTRAGLGRCQGFYCNAQLRELLATSGETNG